MSLAQEWMQRSEEAQEAANSIWAVSGIWAAFLAHQSIEFFLKGQWVAKGRKYPHVHNLNRLAAGLYQDIPDEVHLALARITAAYRDRYPIIAYNSEKAEEEVQHFLKVVQRWITSGFHK